MGLFMIMNCLNHWLYTMAGLLILSQGLIVAQKKEKRNFEFYKKKAAECEKKTTSALMLDIAKKAAIGATTGALVGAGYVGCNMLMPRLLRERLMPYTYQSFSYRPSYYPFDTGLDSRICNPFVSENDIRSDPSGRYTNFTCLPRIPKAYLDAAGLSYAQWAAIPRTERVLSFDTSIAAHKQSREYYIKKNLWALGIIGAGIGALAGSGLALYKQYRALTPEWSMQINQLNENDFSADPVIIGRKAYLVSKEFQETTNPNSGDHYEFYFMPLREQLIDLYKLIIETLQQNGIAQTNTDFVALRLTPITSYSYRKVLPRIIVRLNKSASVDRQVANKILALLYNATKNFIGSGEYPRYSSPMTTKEKNLIFVGFGSGDAKELHPNEFERKGPRFWRAADDMAYKDSATEALSLQGPA